MRTLKYQVKFLTPAFLGDAGQNGRWRTPPFKALLRQWWRVAYAADCGFRVDVAAMRREEGQLFGHAWLDDDHDEAGKQVCARRSLVRIRLDKWGQGQATNWPGPDMSVTHPEVQNRDGRVVPVGSQLYLGYGPLVFRDGTALKGKAAIQAGEPASLSIAMPDEDSAKIEHALWLMDRYGAVGGRCRNGWGSFSLSPLNGTPALGGNLPLRSWRDALAIDWPHAMGRDDQGALVWTTKPFSDWKQLMRELAIVKIGLRTQFSFTTGNNALHPESRHWLSYPVTRHSVGAWRERGRGDLRLPNSLRFKVRPDAHDPAKLVGVIFHVPCRPPQGFQPDQQAIEDTWQAVHTLLDDLTNPPAVRGYASIVDGQRRAQLRTGLDGVTLARSAQ